MAILNNSNAISAGGYDINNSLRFRSSASAYLNRTPSSAGNRQKWTWSGWVKRGALTDTMLLHCQISSTDKVQCRIDSNNNIAFLVRIGNVSGLLITTRVLRDPSAWYHIMFVCDTTQATATTQFKIYVNGVEETAFSSSSATTQNGNSAVNSTTSHQIGYDQPNASSAFDGYLAETYLIDGQALTPSSFGETDTTTGVWKPKAYTGTYGTNGFYLKFSDIATTSGSNAGLGKDFSGNSNYWTTNNISVTSGTTYDAMTDVPTLTSATVANYCVMNPLQKASGVTASDGNLGLSTGSTVAAKILSTIGMSSGKYYCEMTLLSGNGNYGLATASTGLGAGVYLGDDAYSWCYAVDGKKYTSGTGTAYGATYTTNDVIGIAFDADNGTLTYYKNGVSQGTAFTGLTSGPYFFAQGASPSTAAVNFGQRPFTYTPPTGYVALNTYNIPTPTILQGNKYMDATLYTGDNTNNRSITNAASFRPDLVWIKDRTVANYHILFDSVRGGYALFSNDTLAEANMSSTYGWTNTAPTTTGFKVDKGTNNAINNSTDAYVGWQWQAGQGSTSSNTSGSITSTVSVNTTAGFSIVTYTGTLSSAGTATVGHGLGVAPKMIITKKRSDISAWVVLHTSLANWNTAVYLNLTNAAGSISVNGTMSAPTSSVFSTNWTDGMNISGQTYVAYCWAEIAGFSKFGSYTGNGSTDGPFQYCGFRPRWIMWKRTSSTSSWVIWDTARNTYNAANSVLFPDISDAESTNTAYDIDVLSNGFKMRTSNATMNGSGSTYIFAAFAENPFKNANAR